MTTIRSTQAQHLKPGDRCVGPAFFTEQGTVKKTITAHDHTHVHWVGGTHTTRLASYGFHVQVPRRERA